MGLVLDALQREGLAFDTTEQACSRPAWKEREVLTLTSLADPVPVKKQPKYNVTRWALSGRDDLGLNARCFALHAELAEEGASAESWRNLCRLWASDLRTHLTDARWQGLQQALPRLPARGLAHPTGRLEGAEVERQGRHLRVTTDGVELVLDTRRGLAIESARFPEVAPDALFGTLPHGTFDSIEYTADFYSGHTVLEMPGRGRVTDLESCEPEVRCEDDHVLVRASIPTGLGPLEKCYRIGAHGILLEIGLSSWGERPLGSLRTAFLTWMPDAFGSSFEIRAGRGNDDGAVESFPLVAGVEHGASVSPLVSASAALGGGDGSLALTRDDLTLELRWDVTGCPALPMLTCSEVAGRRLMRLAFSVSEVDETHRPGAARRDFQLSIQPRRRSS
jgi:hypothetical protein